MRTIGMKGALASRKPTGLDTDELPALKSHADAQVWLEVIGRAVLTGRITDRIAQAAVKAVSEWIKAYGEQLTAVVLDELRGEVERLKSQVASGRLLQAR